MGIKEKKLYENNYLLYIPEKRYFNYRKEGQHIYLVFEHTHYLTRFFAWLVKKPRTTDLELDILSSYVWEAIDGKKTFMRLAKPYMVSLNKHVNRYMRGYVNIYCILTDKV
jgi:hypothetical protein